MGSKKKIIKTTSIAATPTPVDALTALHLKFTKLKELRSQIAACKKLYQEYDNLLQELLPLFVMKDDAGNFTIKRSVSLGNKIYHMIPFFFNEKKGLVESKVWKSSAFETFAIE